MNGAHDMGGTHGHGPIVIEEDEPAFHADWERKAFGLALTAGALQKWNLDQSRFSRENVAPEHYLRRSYYEMWADGLETMLVQTGVLTVEEIQAATEGATFDRVAEPPLAADRVAQAMARGGSTRVDTEVAPKFATGDRVRAIVIAPTGHTRCPQYVRGRTGVIDRDHGVFIFADANGRSTDPDPDPQHVYAVRFEATELWGPDAQGGAVYVDLWDAHLESA